VYSFGAAVEHIYIIVEGEYTVNIWY